jgi:hypothetical protein
MVHLRVFIASPGDVIDERNLARHLLSEELPRSPAFRGRVTFDPITWDDPAAQVAMLAGEQPQNSVSRTLPRPADCDFVIVILWSRMGTPLPDTERKPNGDGYLSGTEWEYEDARNSKKKPPVLIYRRTEKHKVALDDPDIDAKRDQLERVERFFARFRNLDGSMSGGYNTYLNPTDFKTLLRQHLEQLVWDRIEGDLFEDQPARPVRDHGTQPPLPHVREEPAEEQANKTSPLSRARHRLVILGAAILLALGLLIAYWGKQPARFWGSLSVPSKPERSLADSKTNPQTGIKPSSREVSLPNVPPQPRKQNFNPDYSTIQKTTACADMHELAREIRRTYNKADNLQTEGGPAFSDKPGAEGDPWAGSDVWKIDLFPQEGTLCRQIVTFTESEHNKLMSSEAATLWVLRSGKWTPFQTRFRSKR